MLVCPSASEPSPLPSGPPAAQLGALSRLVAQLEELLSLLGAPGDKENCSANAPRSTLPPPLQLTPCHEMLLRGQQLAGFALRPPCNKIGTTIQEEQRSEVAVFAGDLREVMEEMRTHCKAINIKKLRVLLEEKIEACLRATEAVEQAAQERKAESSAVKQGKAARSDKHSSKRSLLTEKIRQAEREQSQSSHILQTIRANPRVYGNLIEQTKVRDRTAPLNPIGLDSLLRAERFSFSEVESEGERVQVQEQPRRVRSSRVLLSEMSQEGVVKERKARVEVGCSRCEIY